MKIILNIMLLGLSITLASCVMNQSETNDFDPALETLTKSIPVVPEFTEEQLRSRRIAEMIYAAKQDVRNERLMVPLRNNAYDRYSEVLSLEPENQLALSGLQTIFSRYLALANSAISSHDFDRAKLMLSRAEIILPGDARVFIVQNKLIASVEESVAENADFFVLDSADLREKNTAMLAYLRDVGQYIRSNTGARFLITARDDAEGRWIYKVMREAVDGYRLRGDITLGGQPSIKVNIPEA